MALDDPRDTAPAPLSKLMEALEGSGPNPPPESLEAFFARQGCPDEKGCYMTPDEIAAGCKPGGRLVASTGIPAELTYDQAKQLEAVVESSTALVKAIFSVSPLPAKIEVLPEFAAWKATFRTDPAIPPKFLLSLPAHAVEALARGPGQPADTTTHNQEPPHGR